MAKKDIHPPYQKVKMTCSTCHTELKLGSTLKKDTKIDTCSNCHPFYTGSQSYTNAAGRVELFRNKFAKKDVIAKKAADDSSKRLKSNSEKFDSNKKVTE